MYYMYFFNPKTTELVHVDDAGTITILQASESCSYATVGVVEDDHVPPPRAKAPKAKLVLKIGRAHV